MFASIAHRFQGLFIVPALLPILFLVSGGGETSPPLTMVVDDHTVHGHIADTFSFYPTYRLVSNGQVSHGTLHTFGQFNGYSQDSFNYDPDYGFVGDDSFTYHACNANGCVDGTVNLHVVNNAPHAVNDTYTVHGHFNVGGPDALRANDSDPDNDPFSVVSYTQAAHGIFYYFPQYGSLSYEPDHGFTGTDSISYQICDNLGLCDTATATFNVVNNPPNAVDDTYTVHGHLNVGGPDALRANDSDPENDSFSVVSYTQAAHGTFYYFPQYGSLSYEPNSGFSGTDSITYQICDYLGACATGTATLNVVNSPPIAVPDEYSIPKNGTLHVDGPDALKANDSDPEQDSFSVTSYTQTSHGVLTYFFSYGILNYQPDQDFEGDDNFTYTVCDYLGACSTGDGVIHVGNPVNTSDGSDNGSCSCTECVGEPVKVTTGNVYLNQTDYELPGVGPAINISRAYNSQFQTTGLFGQGWSSLYDQHLQIASATVVRFNASDGRATYFRRQNAGSPFAAVQHDFHGQLTQNANGSFTLSMVDGSSSQFNAAGKLTSLADRIGNQTNLSYDANGHLASITDAFGRALTVITNTNGQVLSISDTLGTIATYTYGASNELLSVTYADNSGFNFSYDGSFRLLNVTDALSNIIESHTYDAQGRAITSEKQGGVNHYTLSYLSATETDVTDGLGRVTKYFFDKTLGRSVVTRIEGLCNCGGGNNSQVQTRTYDSQLNVTSKTDALNHVTSYTYDANGNRLTETNATGTVTYTYNGFGEVLTRTDQLNFVTTNVYDGIGNLLTTTDALNNSTTFTYNSRGQLLTATDARGKVNTFTYDVSGNLTQSKDADNITTFFFYDARSRLTKVRDGLSRSTLFAYDAAGRMKKVTHADNSFVTYTYDLAGRRTVVTDERGNPTSYGYDGAYRLTSVTDALNHATSYAYDAMSNRTSTTDALSRTTNYDYDVFNRLIKVTYPPAAAGAIRLFETSAYDADGNVTSRTDTAGRTTSYTYDPANRMAVTTDADNKTTTFQYDALSRVTSLTDALNQQYQAGYDALGRPTSMTRAGVTMSYVYDTVGNRTQRTDYNGLVTNYAYDNLNRLTTITYPARTVTYAYDPMNNLTRATNENGSVYLYYDNRYRVYSFSDPFYYGINYTYDSVGNRIKLKVNGATYTTYSYDAVNRLTNLADSANLNFTYSYDAVNRLTSRSAPNGVTSSYGYDDLDRLTSLMHTAGTTTLNSNLYTYNDANNISNWTTPTAQRTYTYDAVDRLTAVTNFELPSETYSYDALGNRTASHLSAGYGYQPFNRLTNTANATYSYDNNGNLVSKTDALGTWTFVYDEENRLTEVNKPGGLTINYKYDGLGRRIQRTTNAGANERYVYDGNDALIDLNADWSVAATYLNDSGLDRHLRQTSPTAGGAYFLTDHLGSTTALADGSGNLLEQVGYDSFGNSSGSTRTRYTYTGRERDPDTGLLYYRARFFDPQLGRFISEDPLGLQAGVNFYSYVSNNPVDWTDPTGLCKCGLKKGPEYYIHVAGRFFSASFYIGGSTEPNGTLFRWHAEFLNDATHKPECCEVRQEISWKGGGPPNHAGFAGGGFSAGHWYEDRDASGNRYGRRSGPYSDLNTSSDWYDGNVYNGADQPVFHHAGELFSFRLFVVDVCRKGLRIYTSKPIHIQA
jgi:RHS repeat-associated protein